MKNLLVLSAILLCSAVACWQIRLRFSMFIGERVKIDRSAVSLSVFMMPMLRRTAANFKKLVEDGFYKETIIHRVFPNYLVQGGDPLSRKKDRSVIGTGGPGYTLPAEIRRKLLRGSVAMGRLPDNINPNRQSNGSQFYICLQPIPAQDGKDTVFGEVVAGLPALDEISHLQADTNANPIERVVVMRTYIIDRSQLGHPVQVR